MHFADETLAKIREEYSAVRGVQMELSLKFVQMNYEKERAREFAKHGISRRLGTLAGCIDNIFETVAPDRTDFPTLKELTDVGINLHAFVINAFGCVDNLAWLWVVERDVTKEDGSPLSNAAVGLRRQHNLVRGSLSAEFQEYLGGMDDWFEYLESFRHSLAHRIPLYVPPYGVPIDNIERYQEFEAQKREAFRQHDFEEHSRLKSEQMELVNFMPWMTHSFGEDSDRVYFHPQLLSDFKTVADLGQKMFDELTS